MRTIEKILQYKPITDVQIYELEKMQFYNWVWTDWLNFDKLIDEVIEKLVEAHVFDLEKAKRLRKDIVQLVIRHDIDTKFKIWLYLSWQRLATGLFMLLHHFSFLKRLLVAITVFYAVTLTKTARQNYKIIK